MPIELGVSYYGCRYLNHVHKDLEEIVNHGCNAVLLAVSEFDCAFWYKSILKIVNLAKNEYGLRVYWNFWGWGKIFDGEAPSLFVQNNYVHRQISAKSGIQYPSACPNSAFKEYYLSWARKIFEESDVDSLFIDEPHYSFEATEEEFPCRCPICQRIFKDEYGYEMPKKMTLRVQEFREKSLLKLLLDAAQEAKKVSSNKEVTVCFLPTDNLIISPISWEKVASEPSIDTIGTGLYWFMESAEMEEYVKKWAVKALSLSGKYGKRAQVMFQFFKVPTGKEEELIEGIEFAKSLTIDGKRIDSIFGWSYRAGVGSVIESDNPTLLWSKIGEAYRKIRSA